MLCSTQILCLVPRLPTIGPPDNTLFTLASMQTLLQDIQEKKRTTSVHNVTLSGKTNLMLGEHKAGFRRECHIYY